MKLRRLDILGFKSFRFKTGLEVADGVTVVVGPNGCGKSNIVDAIRWAIGSQSAKDLRGRAMEDVIFAGSQNHKPMGYAEVSLTLENNGSGDVPAEWRDAAEIKITRRLFRTGESEYEINGATCRLRDIHELFLGTGVGAKEAYSIIEQGRIGFIVASRPEERRILIEEAAGITRYKFQRKTAERRLERTRENLLRVKDVLDEVGRQLQALERQAKRAAAYKALQSRRRTLEVCAALARLDQATEAATTHAAELERHRAEHHTTAANVAVAEARYAQLGVDLKLRETALEEATEQHFRASARVELLQNNVGHHEREREAVTTRRAALSEQLAAQEQALQRAEADRQDLDARRVETQARLEEAALALDQARTALREAREAESAATRAAQTAMQALNETRGTLARARGRLDALDAEREQMVSRARASADAEQDAEAAWQREQLAAESAAEQRDTAAERVARTSATHQAAVDAERAALAALQTAQATQRKAASEALQAQTIVDGLRAALARGEGYGAGVRALLKAAAAGERDGVLRPLAERLRVEAAHEKRLAAVLGPWLGAAVVRDRASVVSVVGWAREKNASLALLELEPSVAHSPVPWVQFVEPVPAWVADQLQGVALAPDAAARDDDRPTVDDLGGFAPSRQAIQVGVGAAEVSAVKTARRLAEAEAAAEQATADAARASALQRTAEQSLEAALVDRTSARAALERDEATFAALKREATQLADEAARSARRRDHVRREREALAERNSVLDGQVSVMREEAARAESAITSLLEELDQADQAAARCRADAQAAQDALTEVGATHASAAERARTLVETGRRLEEQVRDATVRTRQLSDESQTLEQRARELDALLSEDRRGFGAAQQLADQAAAKLAEVRTKHDELSSARRLHEETLLRLRTDAGRADQRVRDLELKSERSLAEREHAEGALLERFSLSVASARAVADGLVFDDAMRTEIAELAGRMERMGPVNPAAEEAFDEARERFTLLSGQRDDLEQAMGDLEAAIRKMDRTSRERFGEMFHAVNERFQAIYPRLFRGGKARLELTQPDDLLGTGVEIVVQPPGKKLQSMTLMSGGEKALTAVALIFAIFQLKPTPFCILDEVDAPLDDANVARFAAMVEEMSAESQFLIITHNKTTMEAARTLYGVTMQEPGVSNVVGVRLHGRELAGAAG